MKTELEIFRQKTDEFQITEGFDPMTDEEFDDLDEDGLVSKVIIPCMQEYADQFKPKWISVEDELPEEGELVIVVITFKKFDPETLACVFAYNHFWNAEYKDHSFDNVSHWMYVKDIPLPTKP